MSSKLGDFDVALYAALNPPSANASFSMVKCADTGGDHTISEMLNFETSIISCYVSVAVIACPSFIMVVTLRLFGTLGGARNETSNLRFTPRALVECGTGSCLGRIDDVDASHWAGLDVNL